VAVPPFAPPFFPPWFLGSATSAGAAASTWSDIGINYDYAIGGLPFFAAQTPQDPSTRQTAKYQKDRFDSSDEPGDHTLSQWWQLGQSSFHAGAGQLYFDTPEVSAGSVRRLRYFSSVGIDPWTIGQFSLLKQTTEAATTSNANTTLVATTLSGTNYILWADGSSLKRLTEVGTVDPMYSSTTITVSGLTTILALATDGTTYFVADSAGIWTGDIASAGAGTKQYSMPAGTSAVTMAWVKQRLMVGVTCTAGSFVYQLLSAPAAPPVTLTTTTGSTNGAPAFSHPNKTWVWTSIAEGPAAIYVSGFAGSSSSIFRFTLQTGGDVPTLTSGITAADFPPGEIVNSIFGYLGVELAISSTAGVRIAQFSDAAGELSVGRLSAATIAGQAVSRGCVGRDRFIFAGFTHSDGVAGLVRVDPSQALGQRQFSYVPEQQYAYATDLRAASSTEVDRTGTTSALAVVGGTRIAFAVPSVGVYVESPNRYRPTGTLVTSRIRLDTTDPKVFRYVRARMEAQDNTVIDAGTVSISVSTDTNVLGLVGTFALPSVNDTGDLACNAPKGSYANISFILQRATNGNLSPTLQNYQIKALPAQRRQRQITLMLSCFDHETDNSGQEAGGDGTAKLRLLALEELEQEGDFITLQYLGSRAAEQLTNLVVIDEMVFVQSTKPTSNQGWGGVIQLSCRTVDA
jgi:hypothetical protein